VSRQLHAPAALPKGRSSLYSLNRRLVGPQSRSGRGAEEKNSHPLPGLEPPRGKLKLHILTLALDGGEWSAS
jgi:hypothetical protein